MSLREVVTLQIGHYSNFVGTHWWNLQEASFVYDPKVLTTFPKEVNHDVLFREGQTVKGDVTYTPRLVLFDLNNSLGSLKREGMLYDVPTEENIQWLGDVTLHQTESTKKNKFLEDLELGMEEGLQLDENLSERHLENKIADTESSPGLHSEKRSSSSKTEERVFGRQFYDLDKDVNVWSDYLRTALHPRSINLIHDHQHNNPEQPFNVFGLGQQSSRDQVDAIEDKLRFFTEECDQLQGFHILFDSHNAFGGFSASVLSYLRDEFSSKSRLTFALTPAKLPDQTPKERSSRIINSALSLHHCSEYSSLYVPLSLASSLWRNVGAPVQMPKLQYKESLDYHTSAILAASLDTATLPYRKENDPARMSDITSSFNSLGRKVSALNVSLPLMLKVESSFADSLMSLGTNDPWSCLTPHVKCTSSPSFHSCVVRGVPQSMAKRTHSTSTSQLLLSCSSVKEVLRLYLTETFPGGYNAGCVLRDGVQVGSPFPNIFTPDVSLKGFIMNSQRPASYGVEQVPAMTSLQSSADVYSYVDSLVGCVSGFNISKHQHFLEAGLELDDFIETVHELRALGQCYKPDMS